MKSRNITFVVLLALFLVNFCDDVLSQESKFELPVQLVGFPFIIASVRLTNFLKRFSYSVSPGKWYLKVPFGTIYFKT